MGHWGTCPLDFNCLIFLIISDLQNSDIRIHVVAYSHKKYTGVFGCPPVITVVNNLINAKLNSWLTMLQLVIAYACCSLVLHKRNLMHCRVTA